MPWASLDILEPLWNCRGSFFMQKSMCFTIFSQHRLKLKTRVLSLSLLRPCWGHLGSSWAKLPILGQPWGSLWAILGQSWAIVGQSWAVFGQSCDLLVPFGCSWGSLGFSWSVPWPCWGLLGAILGPSWGHLGAILAYLWLALGIS